MTSSDSQPAPTEAPAVRRLGDTVERTRAHGGRGEIQFQRVLAESDFDGPIHFVDYAVLPPGVSIGEHRHGRDEEIYLVLAGEGSMKRDGETFRVAAGDVIVNRVGGLHGLVNDGTEDLRIFVVEVGVPATRASPSGADAK